MKVRDSFALNPVGNTSKYTDFINYIDTSSVNAGLLSEVSLLEDAFPSRAQRLVRPGDILYSSVRPNLRHYYLYNDSFEHAVASTGFVLLRNKSNYNTRFAYYYLSTNEVVKHLSNIAELSQSTFPSFSSKDIGKIDLPDIDRKAQDQIVFILSAYDNLIEINNKRIKVLEQMAENLYKEWFVRFRFPGQKTAEFENGIPKGWAIYKISDIATIKAGGDRPDIFSDTSTEECPIPIFSNGLDADGLYGYTDKAVIENESVTISARGTVGFVCLRRKPYVPIVRLLAVIPKAQTVTPLYLFYYLKRDSVIANGTSQQQITVPMVSRKRMIVPPAFLLQAFDKCVYPLLNSTDILKGQNENLIRQRDLLLPRLMSGKLEV